MLFCANAVALAVINHKPSPQPDVWFGYAAEVELPDTADDPRVAAFRRNEVHLTPNGLSLNGGSVPYTAMINNFGRSAVEEGLENCTDYCLTSPWFAFATTNPETPLSVVFDAARAVRNECNVEVTVFMETEVTSRVAGMRIFFAPVDVDNSSMWGPELVDTSYTHRRYHESVEAFGERTGCGRVSPLRP